MRVPWQKKNEFMDSFRKEIVPIIIDENMLKEAVMGQITDDEENLIVKTEGIHFNEVIHLSLGNRDIMMIAYMWDFTSLEDLYLAHNLIEKIEGLNHLFSLKCLDLSFNHIEKIEGLESLRKLEFLDLSNNRISVIENMDTLENLTEFCIENNVIRQMHNVLNLRKSKKLGTLKLSGNPVCEENEYKLFIVACLPNLMYLDDIVIDEDIKQEALKVKIVQNEMTSEAVHENDFVRFLNGCFPSGSMFKEDPEAETLHCVPEMAQVMDQFEKQIQELFTKIITLSLAEHNQREAERNSFNSVYTAAMGDYQKKTSETIQQHLQRMMEPLQESDSNPKKNITQPCNSLMEKETFVSQTEIMVKLGKISDLEVLKERINHCKNESSKISQSLMDMELLYVSQIADIIKMLDRTLTDMICNFGEIAEGIFTQCRDIEDEYYDKVRKVAVATLEKVAKEEVEMNMSGDVLMLFTDRDTVMDALDTGHANHLRIINDIETQLLAHFNAWKAKLIKGIQDKELLGNRIRLADSHEYVVHLREELEKIQM
ncbi:dynein regulatory complex subunit 3 isoform X1 [Halichoeres trimaculatus]|uniref:dynein regulatory complex subunit 3 isoform X1 n=1 Tax=Halichoeres trimaculatus TaxID=147232 RepID=UPI003D9E6684